MSWAVFRAVPDVEVLDAVTTIVEPGVRRRTLPRPGQAPRPRSSPLRGVPAHVLLRKQLSPRPRWGLLEVRLPVVEPAELQLSRVGTLVVMVEGRGSANVRVLLARAVMYPGHGHLNVMMVMPVRPEEQQSSIAMYLEPWGS